MNASQKKVVQYLNEAHASELALVRVLQSQIAMTPRGTYRTGAGDRTCGETREHAERVGDAPAATLGQGGEPAEGRRRRRRDRRRPGARAGQDAVRPPARLRRRGEGAQERQGRLRHRGAGDRDLHGDRAPRPRGRRRARRPSWPRRSAPTRRRCSSASCARSPSSPTPSCAPTSRATRPTTSPRPARPTPSATPARPPQDARARPAHAPSAPRARPARCRASRRPRARSRAPSRPRATSRSPRYDKLTAEEIVGQARRALADRPRQGRRLRAQAPEPHDGPRAASPRCAATSRGPGYDELTAAEVQAVLAEGDDDRAKQVRAYERAHKNRAGVLKAAERELANA